MMARAVLRCRGTSQRRRRGQAKVGHACGKGTGFVVCSVPGILEGLGSAFFLPEGHAAA